MGTNEDGDFFVAITFKEFTDGINGCLSIERIKDGLNEENIHSTINQG